MGVIEKAFSDDKSVSSKRIIGAICIAIYVIILFSTFVGLEINNIQENLLTNLLYVSGALLGLGTFEKFKTK